MAMTEGDKICINDDDCSPKQYCYNVSGQCVDYTQCNRYNRLEGQKHSRYPSHCGPCLPGHTAEILGTGEIAWLCKKMNVQENIADPGKINNTLIISLLCGALLILCSTIAAGVGIFMKRRSTKREEADHKECAEVCLASPSAPPAESSPFIEDCMVFIPSNNNQNLKDKNRLVNAHPWNEPNWIRVNPNYELTVSNDNLNAEDRSHSLAPLPQADSSSNNWPVEQLTMEIDGGTLEQYDVEQMNTVLVQRNHPSVSNSTDSRPDAANNSNASASGSNDSQDNNGERVRESNIYIAPKICMSVNVVNGV